MESNTLNCLSVLISATPTLESGKDFFSSFDHTPLKESEFECESEGGPVSPGYNPGGMIRKEDRTHLPTFLEIKALYASQSQYSYLLDILTNFGNLVAYNDVP